jgi:hypothetical protein
MSWQQYTLTFRLLAPLHIGWRQTGNLMQTRPYVTGKVFWAALTARLTRTAGNGANGQAYVEIGKAVQTHFRFSYLYPVTKTESGYQTHYPWEPDFDYRFLDSYTSAALNYDSQSAAEGLLHETEFIAPHTRCDQAVYLRGALYVRDDLRDDLRPWQEALPQLQFGADRSYGWGRVVLVQCEPGRMDDGDEVAVPLDPDAYITAHLKAKGCAGVVGPVEPLIGWEWNNSGQGATQRKLSEQARICYAPGSTLTSAATFRIGPDGIWEAQ